MNDERITQCVTDKIDSGFSKELLENSELLNDETQINLMMKEMFEIVKKHNMKYEKTEYSILNYLSESIDDDVFITLLLNVIIKTPVKNVRAFCVLL